MRLLYCNACHTLEEIPDYKGSDEVDPLVERIVRQHNVRDPMAHGGGAINPMRIAVVDDIEYAYDRERVLKLMSDANEKVGFDAWVGEATNTYQEDALKCWERHRRPKQGSPCIDYWSDEKRIGRPTEEGRAALKENYKLNDLDPHLCGWCPYHVEVQTEVRWKKGLYKDQ